MVKCLKRLFVWGLLNLKQVTDTLKMLLAKLAVQQISTNNHIVNIHRNLQKEARITVRQFKLLLSTCSCYLEKNARLRHLRIRCFPKLKFQLSGKRCISRNAFRYAIYVQGWKVMCFKLVCSGYFTAVWNGFNQWLWWFHECDIIMNDKIFKINVLECVPNSFLLNLLNCHVIFFFTWKCRIEAFYLHRALTIHHAMYLIKSIMIYCIRCIT